MHELSDVTAGPSGRWLEILLRVPPDQAEVMAEALGPLCYGGVAIEPALVTAPGSEDFSFSSTQPSLLRGYLPVDGFGAGPVLAAARTVCPAVEVEVREVAEEDWTESWKRHFHPIRVGRLVVQPAWRTARRRSGDVVVTIDPGLAFGTGDHPTTRACLRALGALLKPGDRVLDLGTGSGVLAIAAALLGAGAVLAVDIDPLAVRAARENCERNGVLDRVTLRQGSVELAGELGPADIILANLTSQIHCDLAATILGAVRPGGRIVAAGIGSQALPAVREAYRAAGARRLKTGSQGEWRTLAVEP